MAKRLDSDKRLRIFYMPYNKKIVELFKSFPSYDTYTDEIFRALLSDRKIGHNLSMTIGEVSAIELQIFKFASIRKVYIEKDKREFFFSFYIYSSNREITSNNFSVEIAKTLCDYIFPFILSYGKDKTTIPLLLNDFPSFAHYALEYDTSSD